jgi:hypothetical protein
MDGRSVHKNTTKQSSNLAMITSQDVEIIFYIIILRLAAPGWSHGRIAGARAL